MFACINLLRGLAYHDTVPRETRGTHVKVARIIMRFPEQRGGGVFLSRFEIARPFFACATATAAISDRSL